MLILSWGWLPQNSKDEQVFAEVLIIQLGAAVQALRLFLFFQFFVFVNAQKATVSERKAN